MEQFTFILAIVSLGLAISIFIGNILSNGLGKAFNTKSKSSKVMFICFLVYVISFVFYIFIGNN
ncbi:hypothetical protein F3157_13940 [Virgibacillus dakarensis]|uniref:Mas-related G-protein coupled receptor member D n=1 Tax=Lentibacillus populi TaxID=1827502 RepID=A0A9W5TWL7_9BACI|nr:MULTISPECIES: hypothetical protein [Bacillaceae]MBT2217312.1 hypothetical protein [Virgibacillus dakarensis]MTW86754.1 hypothetical protein [Virgibacillus dakarensis]GGB38110.1 hypothetical protein GCM10011409_14470 [Lentibacillus populi]